jgi:hypothetical protein
MQRAVRLFVIPKDRTPSGPPNPAQVFLVQAASMDACRDEVHREVEARSLRLRSVSFGPKDIVAYAEEPA